MVGSSHFGNGKGVAVLHRRVPLELCIRARLQPGRRGGHMLIPEPLQGRHRV